MPVPRELDANAKIFIWDFDVASLFVCGFAIGVMVGSLLVGMICRVLYAKAWCKIFLKQFIVFRIKAICRALVIQIKIVSIS